MPSEILCRYTTQNNMFTDYRGRFPLGKFFPRGLYKHLGYIMKTGKGLELFEKVAKANGGNVVISPFGIELVLRLLEKGASGSTLQQIRNLLPETINTAEDIKTSLGVFVDVSEKLLEDYTKAIKASGARVGSIEFADHETAANNINNIVDEETAGQIKEVVTPSDLVNVVLLLLSTVALKATWREKFNPKNTYQGNFQLDKEESVITDFMTQTCAYQVIESDEAEGVVMTVEGDRANVILLKPATGKNMNDVLETLKENGVFSLSSLYVDKKVINLHIPKFSLKFRTSLKKALIELGTDNMFNPSADFSKMISSKVFISELLQESCFMINEEGAEAAAGTAAMISRSMPPEVKFDKPFVTMLTDNTVTNIMFAAVVRNPTIS